MKCFQTTIKIMGSVTRNAAIRVLCVALALSAIGCGRDTERQRVQNSLLKLESLTNTTLYDSLVLELPAIERYLTEFAVSDTSHVRDHPDRLTKYWSVHLLGHSDSEASLLRVYEAVRDPDPLISSVAISSLRRRTGGSDPCKNTTLAAALWALENQPEEIKHQALKLIENCPGPTVIEVVENHVRDTLLPNLELSIGILSNSGSDGAASALRILRAIHSLERTPGE
jgi:hypothetical protein